MDVGTITSLIEESSALYVIGILTVASIACKIVFNLYTHFIIYFTPSPLDYRRYGRWALITGSTDGIGKGFAREFAKMGINVFLVSRNPEKLRKGAREIESEFHVEAQYVAFDFTNSDENLENDLTASVYDVISDAIRDLEIGILVNNVGIFEKPSYFLKAFNSSEDRTKLSKGIADMINCNMASMLKMTQLVLPTMVARNKGLIINLSSIAAGFISPLFTLYSSSKKFVNTFSNAISYEHEHEGITVQSIQPGLVKTNMSESVIKVYESFLVPSYKTYARHLLRTVGKERMTHGYWCHALQMWLLKFIPESMTNYNVKWIVRNSLNRERKLRKEKDKLKKFK